MLTTNYGNDGITVIFEFSFGKGTGKNAIRIRLEALLKGWEKENLMVEVCYETWLGRRVGKLPSGEV